MERPVGIEPTSSASQTEPLSLDDSRVFQRAKVQKHSVPSVQGSWLRRAHRPEITPCRKARDRANRGSSMHETQYAVVSARRTAYDSLLWQVPALGVAAQGFLVAAALNKDTATVLSAGLLVFSSLVGTAVLWLFKKLRFHETSDTRLLNAYEHAHADKGFSVVHGRRGKGPSAYRVWSVLLIVFVIAEAVGGVARLSSSGAGL